MESNVTLLPHQEKALDKLRSGAILFGGVGSGKSYTSLFFYLKHFKDKPLYIITIAKKRDTNDWQDDCKELGIDNVIVDSWNNVKNYLHEEGFFIFDEQRVVGYGAWSKSFIKIAKNNPWILLSATPGDTWMDYIPVFIANGFYRNKSDFIDQHVEYDRFVKYPKIKKYHNEGKLLRFRNRLLVPMPMKRHTERVRTYAKTKYDEELYNTLFAKRWNIFEDKPIENASELTQAARKLTAISDERIFKASWLMDIHDKVIVFYNYRYELDILIDICNKLGKPWAQWNGQKHEEIPETDTWLYLVQYTAGSEGWNCIDTNVMLFYSLNYSYRMMEQAEGRIDRLNTPYTELKYYILTSDAKIDKDVRKAVDTKEQFSESAWVKRSGVIF